MLVEQNKRFFSITLLILSCFKTPKTNYIVSCSLNADYIDANQDLKDIKTTERSLSEDDSDLKTQKSSPNITNKAQSSTELREDGSQKDLDDSGDTKNKFSFFRRLRSMLNFSKQSLSDDCADNSVDKFESLAKDDIIKADKQAHDQISAQIHNTIVEETFDQSADHKLDTNTEPTTEKNTITVADITTGTKAEQENYPTIEQASKIIAEKTTDSIIDSTNDPATEQMVQQTVDLEGKNEFLVDKKPNCLNTENTNPTYKQDTPSTRNLANTSGGVTKKTKVRRTSESSDSWNVSNDCGCCFLCCYLCLCCCSK
ncbi:hypothetical protein EDEG_01505 [Edhazardia aedis USNM 41457]|uniref:Uncharacterized protein n=1 Tax=Edhazardia aedis (strain USNM 41457) TaxID=1003232 RepID=J9DSC0_EDHAE|nr:hypothetical protein EDEG_01505 [Edhazardia aedis USNM 41457]|eukprot:EJW04207.1 hypothetical protein EDEG_01505 [Edhazardia aedis USNM 41457]